MRAPKAVTAMTLVLALAAACAKKPATLPTAAGAPKFADFIFPAGPPALADPAVWDRHRAAWAILQGGDTRAADKGFTAVLKEAPAFYPAEAGMGYAALARKDTQGALAHFDRTLTANPAYAPALAGKGEALLASGRADAALEAFEAAITADPALTTLRSRVDVLKFRGVQQHIETARKAADAGRSEDARREYLAAIAASPQSAFLYRELAVVERRSGDPASALVHANQAVALDPSDARALTVIAEVHEANSEWTKAADAYAAVQAVEPSDAIAVKIDAMREKAAFAALPEEYRTINTAPTVTRAQLAALLGVRLEDLIRRARPADAGVMTDVRGNWAAPWILAVTRAGIMEPFANHAFQPGGSVRRVDLAQAVSRVLTLIAAEKPRVAARWRDPRPRFSDVGPANLNYPAVARAVSAGVMTPIEGDTFALTRPVTGAEATETVTRLAALARQ